MGKLFRLWRFFLPLIFLFVMIHTLKDITQDIIGIKTPLDMLGDAKEDLSGLPIQIRNLYFYGLGGLSFLAEIFLLVSIPIVWKRNRFSKLERHILIVMTLLLLYFLTALILDPKYRPI